MTDRVGTDAPTERTCPSCDSPDVVPIAYGFPSPELEAEARDGRVVLGGDVIEPNMPDYACRACGERWVEGSAGPKPDDIVDALGRPCQFWRIQGGDVLRRGAWVDWDGAPLELRYERDGIAVMAQAGRHGDYELDDGPLSEEIDVPLGDTTLVYDTHA